MDKQASKEKLRADTITVKDAEMYVLVATANKNGAQTVKAKKAWEKAEKLAVSWSEAVADFVEVRDGDFLKSVKNEMYRKQKAALLAAQEAWTAARKYFQPQLH